MGPEHVYNPLVLPISAVGAKCKLYETSVELFHWFVFPLFLANNIISNSMSLVTTKNSSSIRMSSFVIAHWMSIPGHFVEAVVSLPLTSIGKYRSLPWRASFHAMLLHRTPFSQFLLTLFSHDTLFSRMRISQLGFWASALPVFSTS